jgi:hypothetical protein
MPFVLRERAAISFERRGCVGAVRLRAWLPGPLHEQEEGGMVEIALSRGDELLELRERRYLLDRTVPLPKQETSGLRCPPTQARA